MTHLHQCEKHETHGTAIHTRIFGDEPSSPLMLEVLVVTVTIHCEFVIRRSVRSMFDCRRMNAIIDEGKEANRDLA